MLLTDPLQPARRTEAIRYLCQAAQNGVFLATQLLYRHHYDASGRYIGMLRESLSEYVAEEQMLF